jgi:hypothetical protein
MERSRECYNGEGGGFPQVQAAVNLMSPKLHVDHLSIKSVQTIHLLTCCLVCADSGE